ncbi:MAG TPA: gliding motility protein GldN [Bacteroidia bacterium]
MRNLFRSVGQILLVVFVVAGILSSASASPKKLLGAVGGGKSEGAVGPTGTTGPPNQSGGSGGILEPPGGGILDGVYTPEHLPYRKPIPYVYIREADVMWQKRIWRTIDLREKINHPLYYPDDDLAKRPSLFRVLQKGIMKGKITTVFEFDPSTMEFSTPLTLAEIVKTMTEQIAMKDSAGNPLMDEKGNQVYKPDTLRPDKVVQYLLKEDWFFDKQRSVMDVRIIGIAPVIESTDEKSGKFSYRSLFWLYYPAIRSYLAQNYCYNPYNDSEWRTYDEIFQKRMFSSFVTMESNVYNRSIQAYLGGQGMEQMLESERIKDDIFKFEHDMWNY